MVFKIVNKQPIYDFKIPRIDDRTSFPEGEFIPQNNFSHQNYSVENNYVCNLNQHLINFQSFLYMKVT